MRTPEGAPARPDLTWLRHRRGHADHVPRPHIDYVHPPRNRRGPPAAVPVPAATPDLSLDLSRPAPATPAAPSRAVRRRPRTLPYPRSAPGQTRVLEPGRGTVTLTRLQSGLGTLTFSLVPAAGEESPSLGVVLAYAGTVHIVQRLGDALTVPGGVPGALPLARLAGERGHLDLRQVAGLERALVHLYSPDGDAVAFDGLLDVSLHDGGHLTVPFSHGRESGTLALLTVYAVHGELVLRSEDELVPGGPDRAAEAYGYAYAWRPGQLPPRGTAGD